MGSLLNIAKSIEYYFAGFRIRRRRSKQTAKRRVLSRRAIAFQSLEHRWLMSAEGIGELAEIQAQVLDSTGYALTPTIVAGVPEYSVITGQEFSIRTRARDLRQTAEGVFSVYMDMNYVTQGNPSTELAKVHWGEHLRIDISAAANGGSFTLTNGTETTTPITYASNYVEMSQRIKNAIGDLSFVGGPDNIRIRMFPDSSGDKDYFDVWYLGSLARQDMPDLVVASNNLRSSIGGTITIQTSSSSDPSNRMVLSTAFSYPPNVATNGSEYSFNSGHDEATLHNSSTIGLMLKDVGNFRPIEFTEMRTEPNVFENIVDTTFHAANQTGIVDFSFSPSVTPRLGVSLLNESGGRILPDSLVDYPEPFRIRIVANAFQNPSDRFDVSADGYVSPIDAYIIKSYLQFQGTTHLSTNTNLIATFPDVDGDGWLSPLDLLQVENEIARLVRRATASAAGERSAEGVGELAQVDVQVLGPNGSILTPNFSTGIPEYIIATGQEFSIRTRARDLRSPNPMGVFSAYTDIQFLNEGSSSTEIAKLLWGESQEIKFASGIDGGSFSLSYDAEVTTPIAFTTDTSLLRSRIENAIGALPWVGGAKNIRVETQVVPTAFDPVYRHNARVTFIGDHSRKDVPDVMVASNSLTSSSGGSTGIQVTSTSDLSNRYVRAAATTYPDNLLSTGGTVVRYSGGAPEGTIDSAGGSGLRLHEIGGFATNLTWPEFQSPSQFVNIVDTSFQAANVASVVDINLGPTGNSMLGVGLFGDDKALVDAHVDYPDPFRIRIVEPPIARPDTFEVMEDSQSNRLGLAANDFLGTNNSFRITSVTPPIAGGGTIEIEFTGYSVLYTPAADFAGLTSFSYTVTDAFGFTSTSTVSLDVTPVNDVPVANLFSTSVLEDSLSTFDANTILVGDLPGPSVALDEQSSQTVSIIDVERITSKGGSISPRVNASNSIESFKYKPALDFVGIDVFTYTLSDNFGANPLTTVGTITVNVLPVNDPPGFSRGGNVEVLEDSPAYSEPWIVMEDSVFPTAIFAGPINAIDETNGSQTVRFEVTSTNEQFFTQLPAIDSTGILTFRPAKDANGASIVSVMAIDSGSNQSPNVNRSETVTFTISLAPVNDAPAGNPDTYTTNEDALSIVSTVNLSDNDSDIESDLFSIIPGTQTSARGVTVTLRPDGTFDYDASSVASFQAMLQGQSEVDSFTYRLRDSANADSESITVTITVEGRNETPQANSDDEMIVASNATTTLNVLANDVDLDSLLDNAELEIVQSPAKGSVSRLTDGQIAYRPHADARGNDTFTYRIVDVTGLISNDATVTIRINPSPIANADTKTFLVGDSIEFSVLANDTDEDGDATIDHGTVIIVNPPSQGNVTVLRDGTLRYLPPDGFKGTATFQYTISDDKLATSDPGVVTVQVVDSYYQNIRNPFDVNDDGNVAPLDVLQVINALRRLIGGSLPPTESLVAPYVDVNGNRSLEPVDVLQVINFLNRRQSDSGGEGEAVGALDWTHEKPEPIGRLLIDPAAYATALRKRIQRTDVAFAEWP